MARWHSSYHSLLPFTLLIPLLAGCAIKTPYLNISDWPVERRAMYYQNPAPVRIGVLPLIDRRPAREQEGQRPGGVFLLLWNRRAGDYYTSDRVFGGQVAERLTDQLIAYLTASHAFAQVIRLPVSADDAARASRDDLSRWGREQVVDFIVGGDLDHFFGSQTQHASMYLLPLYFVSAFGWQDAKSLPWGKTSIRFTAWDGKSGDVYWRQLLEADRTLPKDTDPMSEAALESFTQLAGQLVEQLRPLQAEPGSPAAQ